MVSVALPVGEASASTNPCDCQWPTMPDSNASEATTDTVQCIIGQCRLVCPQSSGKEKTLKMLRRLVSSWRPENASHFKRDPAMCLVISDWLQKLRHMSFLYE